MTRPHLSAAHREQWRRELAHRQRVGEPGGPAAGRSRRCGGDRRRRCSTRSSPTSCSTGRSTSRRTRSSSRHEGHRHRPDAHHRRVAALRIVAASTSPPGRCGRRCATAPDHDRGIAVWWCLVCSSTRSWWPARGRRVDCHTPVVASEHDRAARSALPCAALTTVPPPTSVRRCVGGRSARPSWPSRWRRAPPARSAPGCGCRAEEPDPFRLCFERDLDRIKHSRPWRRLAGKCQVFIAPEDDHLRTRLTHAVEVAQVATGIARAANLCLPAGRGHRPRPRLRPRARGSRLRGGVLAVPARGGYDHAVYGADVTLAPLNLCVETLDGVRNHSWRRPAPSTPEGEVVAWADRIAYVCHDFDDAVRAGILEPDDLPPEVARRRRHAVGRRRSARSCGAVLDAIDQTGRVGDDRAGGVGAGRVPGVQLRAHLPAAGGAPPGRAR